jgi:hypothetical protein
LLVRGDFVEKAAVDERRGADAEDARARADEDSDRAQTQAERGCGASAGIKAGRDAGRRSRGSREEGGVKLFDETEASSPIRSNVPPCSSPSRPGLARGGCEICGRGGRMLPARGEQKNGHHRGRRRDGRYSVDVLVGRGIVCRKEHECG